ncbi:RCC1 domain-containing protein [Lysinibacter cavernae]|uniref:Alpha-tubulin suppressor-like RCC1 family protein n=1 Tax=Lysinibacter cavernae TaxID=1640652 RepID=A0A7X5TTR9_9MICO|nr:hypothetical protein [Lysinibacter cavernae]NIH52912.1 alpha-tubulin suppressor-like RCC1 family protein [Lysinibacter cavernae]
MQRRNGASGRHSNTSQRESPAGLRNARTSLAAAVTVIALVLAVPLSASAGWVTAESVATTEVAAGSFEPQSRAPGQGWVDWEQLQDVWGAQTDLPVFDRAPVVPGTTAFTERELRNAGSLDGSSSIGAAAVEWAAASELNVTHVAAGVRHSLILTADGTVFSFGSGADGQLGVGLFSSSSVPVQVRAGAQASGTPYLTGIVSIAAGDNTSFAVAADGSVYAWGSGYWGSLGDGTSGDGRRQPLPLRVKGGSQGGQYLTGITQLAVESWRGGVLALGADGSVYGWGSSVAMLNASRPLVPARIVGGEQGGTYLTGITKVSAGVGFALALTNDGRALVWGNRDGNSGEMGNGAIGGNPGASSDVPTWLKAGQQQPAQPNANMTNIVDVSAGGIMSIVDRSGNAYLWGGGNPTPTRVAISGAATVTTGQGSPVLFTTTAGEVWAGGPADASGAGGGAGSAYAPVRVLGGAQGTTMLNTIAQVSGGSGFGLARTTTGELYTWGLNELSQLGVGSRVEQLIGVGRISRDATTANVTLTTTMNVQRSETARASLAVRDDGTNRIQATFQSIDNGRLTLETQVGGTNRTLFSSVGEVASEVAGLSITAIGQSVTLYLNGNVVYTGDLEPAEAAALVSPRVSLSVEGASISQTGITAPAVWPTLNEWTARSIGGGTSYGGNFHSIQFSLGSMAFMPGMMYRKPVLHWSNASGTHERVLDLAEWAPSGNAVVTGGVASMTSGSAVSSPKYVVEQPTVWWMTFESAMTVPSPLNADYTGFNAGSSYYDAAGAPMKNNASWAANGYADGVPRERIILAEGWEDLRNWATVSGSPRVTTSDSAGGIIGTQYTPVRVRRAPVLLYSAYLDPTSCTAAGVGQSSRIVDGWDVRIAPGKVVDLEADGQGHSVCLQISTDISGVLSVTWPITAEVTLD